MALIVMGLPGVGKTSVLKEAMRKIKSKVTIINYGDIVAEIAKRNRDAILDLPVKEHLKLQDAVVSRLVKVANKPKTIVDTHAILRRKPLGYIAGLHPLFFKKLKVDGFIFIDAPSDQIIARRIKDKTRERVYLSKDEIDEHRLLSKILIGAYAARTGAPFYIITNIDGKLSETADSFKSILQNIGWE